MAKKKAVKKAKRVGIAARVVACVTQSGLPYWRIEAHNNEILGHSEVYARKHDCDETGKEIAKQLGVEYGTVVTLDQDHKPAISQWVMK